MFDHILSVLDSAELSNTDLEAAVNAHANFRIPDEIFVELPPASSTAHLGFAR